MKIIKISISCLVFFMGVYSIFAQSIPAPWLWDISSDFGPRLLNGVWDFHEGIDYNPVVGDGDLGTPIPAVEGGNIVAIANRGKFYNINIVGELTDDIWLYGHIFRVSEHRINGWELRFNAELVNPNSPSDVKKGNIIILWSGNNALKVLSPVNFAGRWIRNSDNSYISASNGNRITTQGSVITGEEIAPMGDAATNNVHLHLGLNYPSDNPLLHLQHLPDTLPSVTIENPPNNYVFTQDEFNSDYPIRIRVNSIGGFDFDKLSLWIYKNNDPQQLIHLGTPGQYTFSYGGRPDWRINRNEDGYSNIIRWQYNRCSTSFAWG